MNVKIVGERQSGKTALIQNITGKPFSTAYQATIGPNLSRKKIGNITMDLWEIPSTTTGSTVSGRIQMDTVFLLEATAVVITVSAIHLQKRYYKKTIHGIYYWLRAVERVNLSEPERVNRPKILVITKCDEVVEGARSILLNPLFLHFVRQRFNAVLAISAKDGININNLATIISQPVPIVTTNLSIYAYPSGELSTLVRLPSFPLVPHEPPGHHNEAVTEFINEPDSAFCFDTLFDTSAVLSIPAYTYRMISPRSWPEHMRGQVLYGQTILNHPREVLHCAVTPDSQYVTSIGLSDTPTGAVALSELKIWDSESRTYVAVIQYPAKLNFYAMTPDSQRVVANFENESRILQILDLQTGQCLARLVGHTDQVRCCAVTRDGLYVISGSDDGTLRVWSLQNYQCVATLRCDGYKVRSCAVSADGYYVAIGTTDLLEVRIEVWNLQTYRCVASQLASHPWHSDVTMTPDAQKVIYNSRNTLVVWMWQDRWVEPTILTGHTGTVLCHAVTPDGQYVVSGSEDNTLRVWTLRDGRCIATLVGHTAAVDCCVIAPNYRYLISGSWDGAVKLWDLETPLLPINASVPPPAHRPRFPIRNSRKKLSRFLGRPIVVQG